MAKDILINTQSGDISLSQSNTQITYYNVVWGRLFESDENEYMNIIVPNEDISGTQYTDDKYECYCKAPYRAVTTEFLVRLVIKINEDYQLVSDYVSEAPTATGVVCYVTYTGKATPVSPCQLPSINVNGLFRVVFQRYRTSYNFSRALITSAQEFDFTIGDSDSQSAQLLARCAPGAFYRYPTTGLDLTQYVNSVVEHTDMADRLLDEFEADNKEVLEAEFDSATGDLNIVLSGVEEIEDENLTEVSKLDIDIFKIADDDFVRKIYKENQATSADNGEYLNRVISVAPLTYFIDMTPADTKLDNVEYELIQENHRISADGEIYAPEDGGGYWLMQIELEANRIYSYNPEYGEYVEIRNSDGLVTDYQYSPRFVAYDKNGDVAFVDKDLIVEIPIPVPTVTHPFLVNRHCFIPLVPMTLFMYAGGEGFLEQHSDAIPKPISDEKGNYKSLVAITVGAKTGKMTAMITEDSIIQDVTVEQVTNALYIIL